MSQMSHEGHKVGTLSHFHFNSNVHDFQKTQRQLPAYIYKFLYIAHEYQIHHMYMKVLDRQTYYIRFNFKMVRIEEIHKIV